MTRRNEHLSGAVASRVTNDPRQGWLFATEELPSHGETVNRYGDFVQELAPLVVVDPSTESEA